MTEQEIPRSNTAMNPIVRNLRFAIDESIPQYWHGGRRSISIFLDNLSVFFPAGERFFVKAVRRTRPSSRTTSSRRSARLLRPGGPRAGARRYNEPRRFYPTERWSGRVSHSGPSLQRTPEIGQLESPAPSSTSRPCGAARSCAIRLLEGAHPAMKRWALARRRRTSTDRRLRRFTAAGGDYRTRGHDDRATVILAKVIEQQAG
jgi:hypothetical protein